MTDSEKQFNKLARYIGNDEIYGYRVLSEDESNSVMWAYKEIQNLRKICRDALAALNTAPRVKIIGSKKDSYQVASEIERTINHACSVPLNAYDIERCIERATAKTKCR